MHACSRLSGRGKFEHEIQYYNPHHRVFAEHRQVEMKGIRYAYMRSNVDMYSII